MTSERFIVRSSLSEAQLVQVLEQAGSFVPFPVQHTVIGRWPSRGLYRVEVTDLAHTVAGWDYVRMYRRLGLHATRDRPLRQHGASRSTPHPFSVIGHTTQLDGHGVGIAVLDKYGVSPHATFGGRLRTFRLEQDVYVEGPHVIGIGQREGTNVASVAAGDQGVQSPAPRAHLLAYQTAYVWDMMRAIEHAMKDESVCVVVTAWYLENKPDAENDGLDELIAQARDAGVAFLAAAGNQGPAWNSIHEPASLPAAFAVGTFVDGAGTATGAADANDKLDNSSSRGPMGVRKPDFLEFRGAYTTAEPDGSLGSGYGTSLAVARAAGVFATWYQAFGGKQALARATIDQILQSGCIQLRDQASRVYYAHEQGLGGLGEAACEAAAIALAPPR